MKKSIALVLCLALLMSLCLCGCGSEQDKLVGTWTATINLADMVNEQVAADDPTVGEYIQISNLDVTFNLTFNESGTFAMTVDQEKLDVALREMMNDMSDGLLEYLSAMLSLEGLDMDINTVLEMLGISLDDLLDEAYNSMVSDDLFANLDTYGYFYAKDGKLYTGDDQSAVKAGQAGYELYKLENDVLTIDEGTIENDMAEYIYPMTFQKVK